MTRAVARHRRGKPRVPRVPDGRQAIDDEDIDPRSFGVWLGGWLTPGPAVARFDRIREATGCGGGGAVARTGPRLFNAAAWRRPSDRATR